ncbi:Uncharacterized protein dnm_098550 [Desulfonema magnum]|uniref:Uncharacterized protein n=1 Tax=Desulfonema magnum TaxID=45655 RepID=A0A975BXV0_9BACT|nr:Uncharacterized protein dnm_098550 [Desulfonema magnum]
MGVSIHAPRAGSDHAEFRSSKHSGSFNPRPPCGERLIYWQLGYTITRFQSTPPVRGATPVIAPGKRLRISFNPRPPCGERQPLPVGHSQAPCFNPRPPCGERQNKSKLPRSLLSFNPRPPCGERLHFHTVRKPDTSFNPRPPCGERLRSLRKPETLETFQSTPPVRGATAQNVRIESRRRVSIHAPRAGSDIPILAK